MIISATLSPTGAPARVLRLWLEGGYELIGSPQLIDELRRALAYPKLSRHIGSDEAEEMIRLIERGAVMVDDPSGPPAVGSRDPDDDYLIVLAGQSRSVLVSGDRDLLELSGRIPVCSPARFLALIEESP